MGDPSLLVTLLPSPGLLAVARDLGASTICTFNRHSPLCYTRRRGGDRTQSRPPM